MKTLKLYRPNELEYLAELESIQQSIQHLSAVMYEPTLREFFAPSIERLKQIERSIKRALRKPVLPPLDDSMRNPANTLTPEDMAFIKKAREQVLEEMGEE